MVQLRATKSSVAGAAFAVVAFATLAGSAQASPVTQTTPPASGSYSVQGYSNTDLGSVTLPNGTSTILGLTSTVTLVDQGWGGQDPTNGVLVRLLDNGSSIWSTYVAGATHSQQTQTYDISTNPAALAALNSALGSVDWTTGPAVTMEMDATPWAYSGWSLTVSNASFAVTSDVTGVPEPSALALLGTSLILGVSALRYRRAG
jgi:hypothetical protein